jgi:hypothetical protein
MQRHIFRKAIGMTLGANAQRLPIRRLIQSIATGFHALTGIFS